MSRYLIVDFAGHAFQIDLARGLAARGHEVVHSYCSSNVTPHGDLASGGGVEVVPVAGRRAFEKYRLTARLRSEIEYGWSTARLVRSERPDAVLTSNVPLVSLAMIASSARLARSRWVLWLQDVQTGLALGSGAGGGAVRALRALERALIRNADHVVAIGDDFLEEVRSAGSTSVSVIGNWAVIQDLPVLPKDNRWSQAHGIATDRPVFLYAGTLGTKHPPELLLALAEEVGDEAQVVVVSEGVGADCLRDTAEFKGLRNILCLPFQDHADLAPMLASADILVAVLRSSAGTASVPSKVLTYLCAQRPVLAAMPRQNAASRLVEQAGAGLVVEPEPEQISAAASRLVSEPGSWAGYGERARRYAESEFDVQRKAGAFEALLEGE